ncbi:alpha/beta fold hydrolase [Pseudomonas sp. LRF_L74]|uniref:alpha/beta fold hydrolase n=1 Tax=Pseudomonas sp. LRF_L74 TaxID=3369422 RepID=UPI003F608E60
MAFFTHAGCRIHYREQGHGEPLLLVHGLGSSLRDWEFQAPVLAEKYRVVSLDLRGHGESDKPRGKYSIAGFARDVAALIEHLQLPPVHLVGISMGGMVGFQLAADRAELLKSLVIVNSGPEVVAHTPGEHWQVAKRWLLARLLSLETIAKGLGRNMFPRPEQAELRARIEQRWPQNDKRAYLASLDAIIGWSVRERLPGITCPVLVISADRDYTPVAVKARYVKEMPNARLLVIEHSRHATPMDQPEIFNQALLEFLASAETP